MKAETTFETPRAGRFLGQMCKHFGHKVPVTFDERSGRIELPFGHAELTASDKGLRMVATAETRTQLDRVIEVMTSHLERFAFRENPDLGWTITQPAI